jgi:phosphate transport system permease protein
MTGYLLLFIVLASVAGYFWNRAAARSLRASGQLLHSLPAFHGGYAMALAGLPSFVFLILWLALKGWAVDTIVWRGLPSDVTADLEPGAGALLMSQIRQTATGRVFGEPAQYVLDAAAHFTRLQALSDWALVALVLMLAAGGLLLARRALSPEFRARQAVERILTGLMIFSSVVAIFTTVGIVLSLMFEASRFFARVPFSEFLFGLNWEPQIPIRADQVAGLGAFGMLPVVLGTLVITVIALLISTRN